MRERSVRDTYAAGKAHGRLTERSSVWVVTPTAPTGRLFCACVGSDFVSISHVPAALPHDLDEVLANAAIACDPADGADVNTRLRRVSSPRRRDEGLHRQRR
jgi:hypothetical protein